jgi:hypothetical protein
MESKLQERKRLAKLEREVVLLELDNEACRIKFDTEDTTPIFEKVNEYYRRVDLCYLMSLESFSIDEIMEATEFTRQQVKVYIYIGRDTYKKYKGKTNGKKMVKLRVDNFFDK